jgi:hypothetical protein
MSKAKKLKEAGQSLYKSLDIKGLNRESRALTLCAAYLEYPSEVSHQMRIADLSLRSGLSYNALSMVAQRRGWKSALTASVASEAAREAGVVSVVTVESVSRTFSALTMAAGIKAYAQIASEICQSYSRTTQKLVAIWSARIDRCISQIADTANLSTLEAKEITGLYAELSGFLDGAARFISPAAQAQLLTAVNFSAGLPPDLPEDVEPGAFTTAGLQRVIAELGVKSMFDDPEAAKEKFDAYRSEMPSILGTR